MLVLEGLVGLHRTIQLCFFCVTGGNLDLDYRDIEWFALETNRDHSVFFEIASKYFDHFMRRVDSLEKTLMLGGIEGRRKRA